MAAATDLDKLMASSGAWARCLAHGLGECLQVVPAGPQRVGVGLQPDDHPPTGNGHPLAVWLAQVVAVGLGVGGQWAENGSRVRIHIRQRRYRRPSA